MNKNMLEKYGLLGLTWITIAIFTILYVSLIFSRNIWTDEAFTIQLLSRGGFREIIDGTAADVHPPFYYIYLKIFTIIFGDSLPTMKIASLIPLTATLVLGATVISKKFGDVTAFLFVLFFTCIPCSMEFSVQIRMYSLAVFFVTICGIYAYSVFHDGKIKDFVFIGVSGVLAAYTHYFAFMSVIVIMFLLFMAVLLWGRKKLFPLFVTAICMIIVYIPWFPSFYKQVVSVNAGYWIPEITPESVWSYFTWTFDLSVVPGIVFCFLILLKAVSTCNIIVIARDRGEKEIYALACMLVPTVTMLAGIIISFYSTPIYRDQYVFPALALLSLFVGISMRNAKKIILIPVSVFLLLVGAGQYKECYHQEYTSTLLPQTERLLNACVSSDDIIVYNFEAFGFIYKVQFEREFPNVRFEYLEEFDFSQEFNNVWFFDTDWQPDLDMDVLEAYGLTMEPMGHYGIEHNEFDIYRIYHIEG